MFELTKLDIQKMASDLLKVAPDRLDVELEYLFGANGALSGNGAKFPYCFKGDDLTLFFVVGGSSTFVYTPGAFDDLPLYVQSPLCSGLSEHSLPYRINLSDLCRGGFFCSSLFFQDSYFSPFSLFYWRISVR